MVIISQSREGNPKARFIREIERRIRHGTQCGDRRRIARRRQAPHVVHGDCHRSGRPHDLPGRFPVRLEHRAQGLVARDQGSECTLQGSHVERPLDATGQRRVVRGHTRCRAIEEPQYLLRIRERHRRPRVTALDHRHVGRVQPFVG